MVEHPFFLEVDANYLRSEREREATRDRLATIARGADRITTSDPGTARLRDRLLSVVNRATRIARCTTGLCCRPALASASLKQRLVIMKRPGLAALLALSVLVGTTGPMEAAGSVGGSSAGNDYRHPRTSAGER